MMTHETFNVLLSADGNDVRDTFWHIVRQTAFRVLR